MPYQAHGQDLFGSYDKREQGIPGRALPKVLRLPKKSISCLKSPILAQKLFVLPKNITSAIILGRFKNRTTAARVDDSPNECLRRQDDPLAKKLVSASLWVSVIKRIWNIIWDPAVWGNNGTPTT